MVKIVRFFLQISGLGGLHFPKECARLRSQLGLFRPVCAGRVEIELRQQSFRSLRRGEFLHSDRRKPGRELPMNDVVAYAPEKGVSRIVLRIQSASSELLIRCNHFAGGIIPFLKHVPLLFMRSLVAVKSQLWIAVCVYVGIAILKAKYSLEQSYYEILQILSITVFEKTPVFRECSNQVVGFLLTHV